MKFNKKDWVLIGVGKKAHVLAQGYNALSALCGSAENVEQEAMTDGANSEKCKRCQGLLRGKNL